MARQRKWDWKLLVRSMRKQVEDPAEIAYFQNEQLKRVEKELKNPARTALIPLNSSLRVLGTWEGLLGPIKVAGGDISGWQHMRRCLLYRGWGVRLAVGWHDQAGQTDQGPMSLRDQVIECLTHAMATSEDDFAHWCGARVLRSFQQRDGAFANMYSTPFEPFMIHLYALWCQEVVDLSDRGDCPLGVYQRLLDTWETEQDFAGALVDACDYHCDSAVATTGYPEFANTPYHVFPAEILAIRRVRRDLGLPNPGISHKLLDSPFMETPSILPPIDSSLFTRVAARIRSDLPNVGYPW